MKLITQIDINLGCLAHAARSEVLAASGPKWPAVNVEMTPQQWAACIEDRKEWLLRLARRAERKAFVAGWKAARARIEREAKQP